MRQVRVFLTCDEGFVADSLRDFANAYEDAPGGKDWLEVEHGSGFLEFVEVPDPYPTHDEIISGIIAKRKALNEEAMDKEAKRNAHIEELEAKIKALAPRLSAMFDVAEALTNNGFYLGPTSVPGRYKLESPLYCTDGIDHRVGFWCDHPYLDAPARNFSMTGYFGIANGGACGDQHLRIDRHGNVKRFDFTPRYHDYKQTYINDLERVLDKFDEIESGLYEYAKNPISRRK